MQWSRLKEELQLTPQTADRLEEIFNGLQRKFFELCAGRNEDSEQNIIEKLSAFISKKNTSPASGEYLVTLLSEERQGGRAKIEWLWEIEEQARLQVLAELSEFETIRFLHLSPDSLLDIETGNDPFTAYLEAEMPEEAPAGFVCRSPYEYAHVQANGDVYPCCPSKFGKIIGNLTSQSIDEIWNSPQASMVRDSIENGDYQFCNASACEYLRKAEAEQNPLSPKPLVRWLKRKGLLNSGTTPKIINLGSDKTCNLACRYCRRELFKLTKEERERITLIDHHTFSRLSDDTERIVLLGEGDPFASPIYLQKLRTYNWSKHKNLKLKIQTNGLLLTPQMWQSIANSHPVIDWVAVSIDGASAETYAINRGGDFDKLMRNLEFIADLRSQNIIKKFWINFLVQDNNYREIPAFAELGKKLNCDLIEFQRIENWGVYDDAEYRELAVHESWHRNNADLQRVLKHPILKSEGVWLLKLSEHLNESVEMGIISWDE